VPAEKRDRRSGKGDKGRVQRAQFARFKMGRDVRGRRSGRHRREREVRRERRQFGQPIASFAPSEQAGEDGGTHLRDRELLYRIADSSTRDRRDAARSDRRFSRARRVRGISRSEASIAR